MFKTMVTNDLCKVSIGKVIYRVREYVTDGGKLDHYAVLIDRRICKGGSYFSDYKYAVMFMLRVAFNDVLQLELGKLVCEQN